MDRAVVKCSGISQERTASIFRVTRLVIWTLKWYRVSKHRYHVAAYSPVILDVKPFSGSYEQIFSCFKIHIQIVLGALSDERAGLSLVRSRSQRQLHTFTHLPFRRVCTYLVSNRLQQHIGVNTRGLGSPGLGKHLMPYLMHVTLPRNQLLIRYVIMSHVQTVTIRRYSTRKRYKCVLTSKLHHRPVQASFDFTL